MSRVRDNKTRDAERVAEEKRLDKASQKSSRDDGGKFSKMMEGKKTPPKDPKLSSKQAPNQKGANPPGAKSTKQSPNPQKSSTPEKTPHGKAAQSAAAAQNAGQNTFLARQGILNNRFSTTLSKKGQESVSRSKSDLSTQSSEISEAKEGFNENQTEINRTEQGGQRRHEAISRDDPYNKQGMSDNDHSGEDIEQLADPAQALGPIGTSGAANASQPAAAAPRLPDAMIAEIVKRVMVGTDAEGISQFHIEFKDDVLGGVRLEVSSSNGKISAKFVTDDVNVGRLLKASEGQLSRAFGHKGLSLARLEVESP